MYYKKNWISTDKNVNRVIYVSRIMYNYVHLDYVQVLIPAAYFFNRLVLHLPQLLQLETAFESFSDITLGRFVRQIYL